MPTRAEIDALTMDEPSALALRISQQLQGAADFTLYDSELGRLTDYELRVLALTARKYGWQLRAAPGWGKTIYCRAYRGREVGDASAR